MPVKPPQAFRGLIPRVGEPGARQRGWSAQDASRGRRGPAGAAVTYTSCATSGKLPPGNSPVRGNGRGPEASNYLGSNLDPWTLFNRSLALSLSLKRVSVTGSAKKLPPAHTWLAYALIAYAPQR